MKALGLFDRFGERPRRVDRVVGAGQLLLPAHLRPDPPQGFGPSDAVPQAQAPDLLGLAAVDDDDAVVMTRESGLYRQRRLNDEDPGAPAGAAGEPPGGLLVFGQDEGVDEPIEETAGGRIGEDDAAEAGPVDRPVVAEDVPAEAGDGRFPGGPAREHEGVGRRVGGPDDTPLGGKDAGNDRLAGGDPPRQGDAEDLISSWRSS